MQNRRKCRPRRQQTSWQPPLVVLDRDEQDARPPSLGGVENFTRLEITKMWTEAFGKGWKGALPDVLVTGGGSDSSGLLSGFFAQQMSSAAKAAAAPARQ